MATILRRAGQPLLFLVSPPMLKTYLRVTLAFSAATALLFSAIVSYLAFYNQYIPHDIISQPLYFDYKFQPLLASAPLLHRDSPALRSDLPYTVSICLTVPRSPHNCDIGNFMLGLTVYRTDPVISYRSSSGETLSRHGIAYLQRNRPSDALQSLAILDVARPAILPYRSPLFESLHTLFTIPLLIAGWTRESERLEIELADEFIFSASHSLKDAYVAAQISEGVQVYDASLIWQAKLTGVRYLMRYYYVSTFIVAVGLFWATEVVAAFVVWGLVSLCFSGGDSYQSVYRPERGIRREIEQSVEKSIKEDDLYIKEESEVSLEDIPEEIKEDEIKEEEIKEDEIKEEKIKTEKEENIISKKEEKKKEEKKEEEEEKTKKEEKERLLPIDSSAIVARDNDLDRLIDRESTPDTFTADDLIPQSPSSTMAALILEDDLSSSKMVVKKEN
ncbi:putative adipose-regulatory protein-domain-containing protein [Myxozyma melibiosi]|uniref:Adipose-regulatory protein-domain-containing protein n=1 Tax=Myxozyma melibiosi TaxID=54550 RepID=A0ABR1F9I1_9ASCO